MRWRSHDRHLKLQRQGHRFAIRERRTRDRARLELLPGAAVRATIEKLVTVDELTSSTETGKEYELKEKIDQCK